MMANKKKPGLMAGLESMKGKPVSDIAVPPARDPVPEFASAPSPAPVKTKAKAEVKPAKAFSVGFRTDEWKIEAIRVINFETKISKQDLYEEGLDMVLKKYGKYTEKPKG